MTTNGKLTYNDKPVLAISASGKDVYLAYTGKSNAYAEGNGIYTGHDTGGSWFTRGG